MADNQIERIAKHLGVSLDEAKEIAESDRRIDNNEKLFELTPEQQKASKKARSVGRTPTAYNFTKRERKTDEAKAEILQQLISGLQAEVEIINPEREFTFAVGGRKYKVVLSCPRS